MEVSERNLAILCDCLMDAVSVFYNAVIHTANTVGNIGLPVQGCFGFLTGKGFDFLGDLPCLFSGDELGGLNTIHQQPQFVRLKGWVQQTIPFLVFVVFQMQTKDIIQNGTQGGRTMPNYGKYYIGIRLLLLKEYLQANAGKDRIVKRRELEKYLMEKGFPVEKKTLYADFAVLGQVFGLHLEYDKHS